MNGDLSAAQGLNPWALVALVLLSVLTLALPRRLAVAPLLVMLGLMPMGQTLVLWGFNFHLFRVLLLVGLVRIVLRGELGRLQWRGVDSLFMAWVGVSVVLGSLSQPSEALFVNRLGDGYNATLCYLLVRSVIVDFDDAVSSVRCLAAVSVLIAGLMLVERTTGVNQLSVFGGVPELTAIRHGDLRCQGAFRHPILAGAFGATAAPLFVGLWACDRARRWLPALAVLASLVIVFTSSSSGALLALAAGFIGVALWPWRSGLPLLRKTGVLALLAVALVMNAPVWYLLAHASTLVGGEGWHRAWLIDQAVSHVDEWALFGTVHTAHWGPAGEVIAADPTMMDITNHYVMEGVKGGALKLLLFIAIIVTCFKRCGRCLADASAPAGRNVFIWCLGVSLVTHCVAFLSVNYFDQTILVWFWLVAVIYGVTQTAPKEQPEPLLESRASRGDPWMMRS
jgi:hypothetical protein